MPLARSRSVSSASSASAFNWSRVESRLVWVAVEEQLGEPELHLDGHEVLLGAVVEVALESPALLILGG